MFLILWLQALPPKKGFIRGISYLTGYLVSPTNGKLDQPGSQVTYVTQSDPKGKNYKCINL